MTSTRGVPTRLIALIAALALVIGCAPAPTGGPIGSGAPTRGGSFRMALIAEVVNTSLQTCRACFLVYQTMFNSLVTFEAKTFEVKPELAESWSQSPDGM